MNATLLSIRHFPLRRCLLRYFGGVFSVVCVLVVTAVTPVEAEYTFTLVADTTGGFSQFYFPSPSLNAAGTVAFAANLDNGRVGIFSGNGGSVTTIAITALPGTSFGYPSINQAGTVAFSAFRTSGLEEGILAGNGGPLVTIADTTGQFRGFAAGYTASINGSGTVAFTASLDAGGGGYFASNGGVVTQLFLNTPMLHPDFNVAINEVGTVVFRAYFGQSGNNIGIVTVAGGLITTIADSSGPLNYFGAAPSINAAGMVAFAAGGDGGVNGVSGIYTGNGGPLTTIADLAGPFSSLGDFSFYQPSINASGEVAFSAALDAGGGGVFIGDGTTTSEVIQAGDPLFGSTVKSAGVSPHSLNDSGQVAFYYELANGTTGIAIANPVPEPSTSLLVALSLSLSLARRTTRKH